MPEMTINIRDGAPEGYDVIAFGRARHGEEYVDDAGNICEAKSDMLCSRLIVRRKPPVYREPTPEDAGRMVEVRNFLDKPWGEPQELVGILTSSEDSVFVIRHGTVGYLQQWRFARIEA